MSSLKFPLLFLMTCSTGLLAQNSLHIAASQDDVARINQLLDAGAVVDATMDGGNTALMVAAKFGKVNACKTLLDRGAKVNQANNEGNTPMMIAVSAGRAKVVQFLMTRKADLSIKNKDGMDARDLARLMDYEDILKLLI